MIKQCYSQKENQHCKFHGCFDLSCRYHAAVKLKDQNTKLKNQLKELKVVLKDTLIKVQTKQKQSLVEKSMESRENVLARELDGLQKQLVQYRKEAQTLKNKLDSIHHQDRLIGLTCGSDYV